MKTNRTLVGMLLLGLLLGLAIGPGLAQGPGQTDASPHADMGTAFTYQGQLTDASGPVDDECDFEFSLWDEAGSGEPPTGGTQVGTTQAKTNVTVSDGLLTIPDLDFGGAAFNGEARWLQIAVRCPTGSGTYATLAPRQALTPAPYALALPGLWTQQNDTSPNIISGYSGNEVAGGVVGATIGGGGSEGFLNRVTDDHGIVGGGISNTASNRQATVGGGTNNMASGLRTTVGGGRNNEASGDYATVPGGYEAVASHYGEMAYASGDFYYDGDAQTSVYVLRGMTGNATPRELFLDGIDDRLTIAAGRTVTFDILLVARSSAGDSIGCTFQGVIENTGGTTTFVQAPGKICHKGGLAWDANIVANDTNDALRIEVTGAASTIIYWVARVQTVEVSSN